MFQLYTLAIGKHYCGIALSPLILHTAQMWRHTQESLIRASSNQPSQSLAWINTVSNYCVESTTFRTPFTWFPSFSFPCSPTFYSPVPHTLTGSISARQ